MNHNILNKIAENYVQGRIKEYCEQIYVFVCYDPFKHVEFTIASNEHEAYQKNCMKLMHTLQPHLLENFFIGHQDNKTLLDIINQTYPDLIDEIRDNEPTDYHKMRDIIIKSIEIDNHIEDLLIDHLKELKLLAKFN